LLVLLAINLICQFLAYIKISFLAQKENVMTEIIEWAPFQLKRGVREDALVDASQTLQQNFLQTRPGFVSRRLLRAPDGSYIDMVVWSSRADAEAAMTCAADSSACSAYFALMDADHADPGAGVAHFEQLALYS
jgi:hypothetical protein